MIDGLTVGIRGVDVIKRNLKDMSNEMRQKHARSAVRKAAGVIRDEIQIAAERKFSSGRATGNLASSVVARVMRRSDLLQRNVIQDRPGDAFGYEVGFLNRAFYWYFFEYGAHPGRYALREFALGARATRRAARVQAGATGKRTRVHRPFARAAFERGKRRALERMLDELALPLKKPRRQK
jgi:HK97 gp10 family phage protein